MSHDPEIICRQNCETMANNLFETSQQPELNFRPAATDSGFQMDGFC